MGGGGGFDREYMRRMSAHHAQGIKLAELASVSATDPHLRALARLMAAAQRGEIAVFDRWWHSWFEEGLPVAMLIEDRDMPGMLSPEQLVELRDAGPEEFDQLFVDLMTIHHQGAVVMADEALDRAEDLRLKLMSHSIRHQQLGQIELMRGNEGISAVRSAVAAMFSPQPRKTEPDDS